MADAYKGIKIEKSIIIVEKYLCGKDTPPGYSWSTEEIPQGYVVLENNPKMLATAMSWAETYKYSKNEYGEFYLDERNRWVTETVEGTVHTYENGQFELTVYDSADGSTQGGKLSFWTVIIKAPDGKQFRIGINADILLELLKHNTFEKGKCLAPVWLGRMGGKVGAYTTTMPDFAQAIKDEEFRNKKPTVKYKVGDVLRSKTELLVYMGEQSERFSLQRLYEKRNIAGRSEYTERNYALVVDNEPVIRHLYWEITNAKYSDYLEGKITLAELFHEPWYHCRVEAKKLSRIIDGNVPVTTDDFWKYEELYYQRRLDRRRESLGATKEGAYEYPYRLREAQQAELELKVAQTHRFFANYKYNAEGVKSLLTTDIEKFILPQVTTDTIEGTWTDAVVTVLSQDDYIRYLKRKAIEIERYHSARYYTKPSVAPRNRDWKIDIEEEN